MADATRSRQTSSAVPILAAAFLGDCNTLARAVPPCRRDAGGPRRARCNGGQGVVPEELPNEGVPTRHIARQSEVGARRRSPCFAPDAAPSRTDIGKGKKGKRRSRQRLDSGGPPAWMIDATPWTVPLTKCCEGRDGWKVCVFACAWSVPSAGEDNVHHEHRRGRQAVQPEKSQLLQKSSARPLLARRGKLTSGKRRRTCRTSLAAAAAASHASLSTTRSCWRRASSSPTSLARGTWSTAPGVVASNRQLCISQRACPSAPCRRPGGFDQHDRRSSMRAPPHPRSTPKPVRKPPPWREGGPLKHGPGPVLPRPAPARGHRGGSPRACSAKIRGGARQRKAAALLKSEERREEGQEG